MFPGRGTMLSLHVLHKLMVVRRLVTRPHNRASRKYRVTISRSILDSIWTPNFTCSYYDFYSSLYSLLSFTPRKTWALAFSDFILSMFRRVLYNSLLHLGGTKTNSLQIGELIVCRKNLKIQSTLGCSGFWENFATHPLCPSPSQLQIVWIKLLRHADVISLMVPGARR